MFKKLIVFICSSLFLVMINYAQDHPYPILPQNTETIQTPTPTLQWNGNADFITYTVEIFECDYVPGQYFNSLKLDEYELIDVKEGLPGYETSALTINESLPDHFFTVDDDNSQIIMYNNNFNDSQDFLVPNFPGNDYEGLSYLSNNYLIMVEERLDKLLFLKLNYSVNNSLINISLINSVSTNNPMITGFNNGYEGITYNPVTNKLYLIKEYNPPAIFECTAPTAPNFSEPIVLTQPFNLQNANWVPDDVAGLYHLSLNQPISATLTGGHLLILSEENNAIYEVDLNGNLFSQITFDVNGAIANFSNGFFKPEGIAYRNGKIWIASEGNTNNTAKYYVFQNTNHANPVANLGNRVFFQSNIPTTQWQVSNCKLKANTNYCWKVTGHRNDGSTAESTIFNFFTQFQNEDCGSNCPLNVAHSVNSLLTNLYRAQNSVISSANTNNGNGELRYFAGNRITLDEGFHANQIFSAYIEACP